MITRLTALRFLATAIIVIVPLANRRVVAADAWGSIKGQFVYDGVVPAPVKLNIAGQPFCGGFPLVQEDLVIDPKGGLANVVVWVRGKVKVNPKFAPPAAANVILDNKNCHFVPHVVGLQDGQTLEIKNSDPVAHNTKIDGVNTQVNPLIPAGDSNLVVLAGAENLPAPISCSIHGWMHAWMVARPNPYFAISDGDGKFEIKDLPVGDLEFQVWHEQAGYVTDVTIGGKQVKWAKGRVTWAIKNGKTTDVGEIKFK